MCVQVCMRVYGDQRLLSSHLFLVTSLPYVLKQGLVEPGACQLACEPFHRDHLSLALEC